MEGSTKTKKARLLAVAFLNNSVHAQTQAGPEILRVSALSPGSKISPSLAVSQCSQNFALHLAIALQIALAVVIRSS